MELYRAIILEHYRTPHNKGHVPRADRVGDVSNTTCGDTLRLELQLNATGVVEAAAFTGVGCAVSQAAASLLTDTIKGKSLDELHAMTEDDIFQLLGGPVSPGRQQCALLVLKAVERATTTTNDQPS